MLIIKYKSSEKPTWGAFIRVARNYFEHKHSGLLVMAIGPGRIQIVVLLSPMSASDRITAQAWQVLRVGHLADQPDDCSDDQRIHAQNTPEQ